MLYLNVFTSSVSLTCSPVWCSLIVLRSSERTHCVRHSIFSPVGNGLLALVLPPAPPPLAVIRTASTTCRMFCYRRHSVVVQCWQWQWWLPISIISACAILSSRMFFLLLFSSARGAYLACFLQPAALSICDLLPSFVFVQWQWRNFSLDLSSSDLLLLCLFFSLNHFYLCNVAALIWSSGSVY